MTIATIGAAIFSILTFCVNRYALRWAGIVNERAALFTALGAFVLLLGAATAGAIDFVTTKPSM
jgi:hypothetical protein